MLTKRKADLLGLFCDEVYRAWNAHRILMSAKRGKNATRADWYKGSRTYHLAQAREALGKLRAKK